MAQAQAKTAGIYGSNHQYRQVREVFDLEEGYPLPDWAEAIKPPEPVEPVP